MNLLIVLSFFVQTDSIIVDSSLVWPGPNICGQMDTIFINDKLVSKSIMFQPKQDLNSQSYKYNHVQGFFCDFEDKVNKNKKINLNVGVGEQ